MATKDNKNSLDNLIVDKISDSGLTVMSWGGYSGRWNEEYKEYEVDFSNKYENEMIFFEDAFLPDLWEYLKWKNYSPVKVREYEDLKSPEIDKRWLFDFEGKEAFFLKAWVYDKYDKKALLTANWLLTPIYIYFNPKHPKITDIEKDVLAYFDKYEGGKNDQNK